MLFILSFDSLFTTVRQSFQIFIKEALPYLYSHEFGFVE